MNLGFEDLPVTDYNYILDNLVMYSHKNDRLINYLKEIHISKRQYSKFKLD